jgi:superfamily II DNA or RNA helicase
MIEYDFEDSQLGFDLEKKLIGYFDDIVVGTFNRMIDAAQQDRILSISLTYDGIEAVGLQGKKTEHRVELYYDEDDNKLIGGCSCSKRDKCHFSYSVALTLLWYLQKMKGPISSGPGFDFPKEWYRGIPPKTELTKNIKKLIKFAYDQSNPKKTEEIWWEQFIEEARENKRFILLNRVLKEEVGYLPAWYVNAIMNNLYGSDHPVDQLLKLPQIIGKSGRFKDIELPDNFFDYLEAEKFKLAQSQRSKQLVEAGLLNWLTKKQQVRLQTTQSAIEVVWRLEPLSTGEMFITFQLFAARKNGEMYPRKIQGIRQLATEIKSNNKVFPYLQSRFVQWLVETPEICARSANYYNQSTKNETSFSIYDAINWMNHWSDSGIVRWEHDRKPVKFFSKPAVLKMSLVDCEQGEKKPKWVFRVPSELHGTEDKEVSIDKATIVRERFNDSYYQKHDRLYLFQEGSLRLIDTCGLPVALVLEFVKYPEVPVELLKNEGMGEEFIQSVLNLADSSSETTNQDEYITRVSVDPHVELRYGDSSLEVVVKGQVNDPSVPIKTVFYKLLNGGWKEYSDENDEVENVVTDLFQQPEVSDLIQLSMANRGEDPTENEEGDRQSSTDTLLDKYALARLPKKEDVASVDQWIDSLGFPPQFVVSSTGHPGIFYKIPKTKTLDLVRWWTERPQKIKYLGNHAFQELVTVRKTPNYSIEVESSGVNWLKVSVEMESEIDAISLEEIEAALREDENELVMLSGGRLYSREDLEAYRSEAGLLDDLGLSMNSDQPQSLHAMHLAGKAGQKLLEMDDLSDIHAEKFQQIVDRGRDLLKSFKGVPHAKPIPKVAKVLRSYQQEGVDFLAWAAEQFGGAVLADDMGLGKTLQVLAAMTAMRKNIKKVDRKPCLVICPASVVHNWQREVQKFTPGMKVYIIESGRERLGYFDKLNQFDLVVTNYALARRDIEHLQKVDWQIVCIDEAQAIKNPTAGISKAVKTLSAECRLALTGTPIENRLSDLHSIVDFAVPGYLPHAEKESKEVAVRASEFIRLRARLRPILLRRLKSEVATDLPDRIEERIDCEMTPNQRRAYVAEVKKTRLLLGQIEGAKGGQGKIQMLAALTRLRQICCDPALVKLGNIGSGKVKELIPRLEGLLESGHKVLVFSQFVTMLDRIQIELNKHKIPWWQLTGKMGMKQRYEAIDAFQASEEPGVFLISLKAGGTGLNLTAASHVILFDPWWNPAVEAQAIDRTHRIGQDKTVVAFRLVTMGTIEERIIELQEMKRSLVKNVLEEEAFNRTLNKEDFKFLLGDD